MLDKVTQNALARKHGIPAWLKRYQARYGRGGVEAIVACHMQNDAPMLNNARDRADRKQLQQGAHGKAQSLGSS